MWEEKKHGKCLCVWDGNGNSKHHWTDILVLNEPYRPVRCFWREAAVASSMGFQYGGEKLLGRGKDSGFDEQIQNEI